MGATFVFRESKFDKLVGQEIKNGIVDATVELLPY
jgi:hypothetical protein